jgi:hypothetical protein
LPFFPASAVYSARHPAGLLHPASGHGVRQVSSSLPALCPKARGWGFAFPCGVLPFGVFPSAAGRCASPHAGSLSPLLRASGRGSSRVATFGPAPVRSSLDLRALLRYEVRCESAGVSTDRLPDTPLGLVPCWFRYLPFAAPRSGGRLVRCGPEGPLRAGQGFRRFIAPPKRVELASDAWPWSGLGPEGLRSGASGAPTGPEGSARAVDPLATRRWLRCRLLGLPNPKVRALQGSGALEGAGGAFRKTLPYLRGGTPLPSFPLPAACAV